MDKWRNLPSVSFWLYILAMTSTTTLAVTTESAPVAVPVAAEPIQNCCETPDCSTYNGNIDVSELGTKCLPWSDYFGTQYDSLFSDKSVAAAENYCRNPGDNFPGPVCIVSIPSDGSPPVGQNCSIPLCDATTTSTPAITTTTMQATTTTPPTTTTVVQTTTTTPPPTTTTPTTTTTVPITTTTSQSTIKLVTTTAAISTEPSTPMPPVSSSPSPPTGASPSIPTSPPSTLSPPKVRPPVICYPMSGSNGGAMPQNLKK